MVQNQTIFEPWRVFRLSVWFRDVVDDTIAAIATPVPVKVELV